MISSFVTTGPGMFSASHFVHLVVIPAINGYSEFLLSSLYVGLVRVQASEIPLEEFAIAVLAAAD